jgi:hypothetical protein
MNRLKLVRKLSQRYSSKRVRHLALPMLEKIDISRNSRYIAPIMILSGLWVSIEWSYGEMLRRLPFLANYLNFRILGHKNVAHYPLVGLLLRNAVVCLRGVNANEYFDCTPPTLLEYFNMPNLGGAFHL